ncbi:MAG: RagB/SusD family nutrient uptake outer membrane protein [Saprospiraceae bacterium]
MKKLLFIYLAIFLCSTSCTDLALTPEDGLSAAEAFKDPDAYRSYLAKLYAAYSLTGQDGPSGDGDISIVNDEGFTSYIRVYWKAQELTTDEAVIAWTDAGIRDLHEHSWTSENQFVRVLYYRIALIVSIANDFIAQSSPEKLTENGITGSDVTVINRYREEARFLRAMAYWHALDFFKNVALVTEISADFPTQSSPTELFNFIDDELKDLESKLAAPRTNEYGRVDQAALWMLQAKLYLNAEAQIGQNKYTECITACKKVIDAGYSLDAEYRTLFMTENDMSNEIIFALNSDGKNSQNWGSTTFLVHGAIGGEMDSDGKDLINYGISGGWDGMRTTSSLVSKFPDVTGTIDSRAIFYTEGHNLEIDDIGTFTDGYAVPKYLNISPDGVAGSDITHVDTDYPMFRLPDAYLMYAEAVLRGGTGGDIGLGVDYINRIRERAYGNTNGNITAGDLDLDFILDERSRELYWEATRRIDLIRFGQYTDQGIWPWKGNVKEGRLTEKHRDIFPIPASDLLANPNLEQNTGY